MKVELKSKDVPMTRTLVEQAERRLRYALQGFGDRVSRVRLFLIGDASQPDGTGYRCRIQAQMDHGAVVLIEERRRHPVTAIVIASEQIAERVAHRLQRVSKRRSGARQ